MLNHIGSYTNALVPADRIPSIAVSKDGSTYVQGANRPDGSWSIEVNRIDENGALHLTHNQSWGSNIVKDQIECNDSGDVIVFSDAGKSLVGVLVRHSVENAGYAYYELSDWPSTKYSDFGTHVSVSPDGQDIAVVALNAETSAHEVLLYQYSESEDDWLLVHTYAYGSGVFGACVALGDETVATIHINGNTNPVIRFLGINKSDQFASLYTHACPFYGKEYLFKNVMHFDKTQGLMVLVHYQDNGDTWRQEMHVAFRADPTDTFEFKQQFRSIDELPTWNDGWGIDGFITDDGDTLVLSAKAAALSGPSGTHGQIAIYDISSGHPVLDKTLNAVDVEGSMPTNFGHSIAASGNLSFMAVLNAVESGEAGSDTYQFYFDADKVPCTDPSHDEGGDNGTTPEATTEVVITRTFTETLTVAVPESSAVLTDTCTLFNSNEMANKALAEGKVVDRKIRTNVDVVSG